MRRANLRGKDSAEGCWPPAPGSRRADLHPTNPRRPLPPTAHNATGASRHATPHPPIRSAFVFHCHPRLAIFCEYLNAQLVLEHPARSGGERGGRENRVLLVGAAQQDNLLAYSIFQGRKDRLDQTIPVRSDRLLVVMSGGGGG